MTALRIAFRGLHDAFESLLPFTIASLLWWAGVLTVALGPGATMALFRFADPRFLAATDDRPGVRESIAFALRNLGRGWKLALISGSLLFVLFYNLWFYGSRDSWFSILGPIWLSLLLLGVLVMLAAFATAALLDLPAWPSFRQGFLLTMAFLPRALVVMALILILTAVGGVLVVPLVMFLPATFAAILNRFVLTNLRIPIPDPLAPTDERLVEEAKSKESKRFGP
ncbi:MAG TPA: hypothetical protein VIL01_01185 [Thermomicrobiales bacterium]